MSNQLTNEQNERIRNASSNLFGFQQNLQSVLTVSADETVQQEVKDIIEEAFDDLREKIFTVIRNDTD